MPQDSSVEGCHVGTDDNDNCHAFPKYECFPLKDHFGGGGLGWEAGVPGFLKELTWLA